MNNMLSEQMRLKYQRLLDLVNAPAAARKIHAVEIGDIVTDLRNNGESEADIEVHVGVNPFVAIG